MFHKQIIYHRIIFRNFLTLIKYIIHKKMIQLQMQDEEAEFIYTSGKDPERYATKEELYNVALRYIINQRIYMKNLEDAIDDIFANNENDVNFIVGSFYTYGTVINKIRKMKN